MAIPGVPAGVHRLALEAFVAALRSSPLLGNNRVLKTWILWDGQAPIVEPAVDAMPAIQFRMLAGPVRRIAGGRAPGGPMRHIDETSPTILIDLAVKGTNQNDLADLADLVHRALAPIDPNQRAALQERFRLAGIHRWQLTRTILPGSAESFALESVSGQGAYTLTIHTFS